ncbi:MAG: carbohydrate porin [Candidatus Binatia bacterium]|nr:carbohydrate porin [Candidatus Binatia bacterium]
MGRSTIALLVCCAFAAGAAGSAAAESTESTESESTESESTKSAQAEGDRAGVAASKRMHPPKKRDQSRAAEAVGSTTQVLDRWKKWLGEKDFLIGFDLAFYDQYASRVRKGQANAATFAWQLFVDYQIYDFENAGALHVAGTFLGTFGTDYNPAEDPLSDRVGAISTVNGNVYPNGIAVDEFYAHYLSDDTDWVFALGKLDMSYFFDTNRVANDAYRQFVSFAFENDLSIPFPIYGGAGALARWNASEDFYVMLGAGDASTDERIPWGNVVNGSWWQLLEAGLTIEPEALGVGNYRLTGWHSDSGPGNGFGIGINIAQNLGVSWLVGFFRAGTGDPSQTNVRTALSGGLSFQGPFGRPNDEAGVALSWADPATGGRDETFGETFYRIALTPRLSLSPGLQIVMNPSENLQDDLSVVGGVRVLWML